MLRRPPLFREPAQSHRVDAHAPLLASIRAGKIDFRALGRGHYPGERLAAGELPGLLSVGHWDARGVQDWGMDFHRNEGVEICLLETGSMRFAVEDENYPLGPGDLTITRPWQAHRQGDPRIAAGRLHWATIAVGAQRPDQDWRWPRWSVLAASDAAELTRRLRRTKSPVWRASPDVVRSFRRMAAAMAEAEGRRLSRVAVGLNELLLGVLDLLRAENRVEQPQLASPEHSVELFLRDLRTNLNSLAQVWTLAGMAAACGMGTTQFSLLCRRLTNDSPLRYLNLVRLEAAARLLRVEPGRSVTDIAYGCGFGSSQYFANQFRRHYGKAPSEFRAG
jgi:AraC-like DNA-binding protein